MPLRKPARLQCPKAGALVVDDNDTMRKCIGDMLRCDGIIAYTFADPLEAISWAEQNAGLASVAVIEHGLPAVGGTHLAHTLLGIAPFLGVVFCSSSRTPVDEEITAGFPVLLKPFLMADFRGAYTKALLLRPGAPFTGAGKAGQACIE